MSIFNRPYTTIDHGNTRSTVFIHDINSSKEISLNQFLEDEKLMSLPGIISKVGPINKKIPNHLIELEKKFDDGFFLDMPVNYSCSLGDDRLITAYYAFKTWAHEKNVLLIDAGTFCTLDIISPSGFHGGYIIPGESTYLKSFKEGAQLPIFEKAPRYIDQSLPKNTESAILNSYHLIIGSFIEKLCEEHKIELIVFTGGSSDLLEKILMDNPIESIPQKDLVHLGLTLYFKELDQEVFQ